MPRLRAHARRGLEAGLQRIWWQPSPGPLAMLLLPLAGLFAMLGLVARKPALAAAAAGSGDAGVPVLVVGNLIVGGAGKTPTVMALVDAFRAAGRQPGVVSRGHGRSADALHVVGVDDPAGLAGDEPLLIARRSGAPVVVGSNRAAAVQLLCSRHPEVDVVIADDGLQHAGLRRDAELLVFDDRGAGNGLLLPAGPLRQRLPAALLPKQWVLYTGSSRSTPLPGACGRRTLRGAWPLPSWQAGDWSERTGLEALRGRPLLAVAGLAEPERFFRMLRHAGLDITALPLPDHHAYHHLPWPETTAEVVTTEKDAVKLPRFVGSTRVWVLPLDFELPDGLAHALLQALPKPVLPLLSIPPYRILEP